MVYKRFIGFFQKTSGDRAYILSKGIDFKQVNLQSRVVIGLTRYNLHGFRHSAVYDKKFIKILMISVVGLPEIRGNSMDPMKMDFIKGILYHITSKSAYCSLSQRFLLIIHFHHFQIYLKSDPKENE